MGEYLTIIWDAETPAAAEISWDNCMLVVQGDEASLSESTVYACTADDWSTQLVNAGFATSDQAYESASIFFSASPTPGCTLFVLALVSGAIQTYTDSPLIYVSDYIYETPVKPPLQFYGTQEVKYFPDAENTGYWTNKQDGSVGMGFTVVNDEMSNWAGRLNFLNGLSGNVIDDPPRTGSKITCSFNIGQATADITETIETYSINMMAPSYQNTATKACYTSGDSNAYFGDMKTDIGRFINAIAGKNCILFYALPGGSAPGSSGCSLGEKWEDMKNLIGQREDVALLKAKPSALNHDMAAGYMGMTASTHPHTTMSFAVPHMGITEEESLINRTFWNGGQIASPMQRRELSGSPYLISHGFTLGTGYSSRINYVRCKYIISQSLVNGLWALLAERSVRMSYVGMQLVKNKIAGIFKTLQDQGILDGLEYIRIPVENDLKANNAAGQAARAARTIPSIEIGFYWYSSLEKITITGIRNEA